MKNNILIPLIAIFISPSCFSMSHDPIPEEKTDRMSLLVNHVVDNPEWQTFCDEQENNLQCKFIKNADLLAKKFLILDRESSVSRHPFKRFVYSQQKNFIRNQLNSDSYSAALIKNCQELSLQIEQQQEQLEEML